MAAIWNENEYYTPYFFRWCLDDQLGKLAAGQPVEDRAERLGEIIQPGSRNTDAMLDALGYGDLSEGAAPLTGGATMPALFPGPRSAGAPLWVVRSSGAHVLGSRVDGTDMDGEEALTRALLDNPDGPAHVMLAGPTEVLFTGRARWGRKGDLLFRLDEMDADGLRRMAALLSRESVCGDGQGRTVHDHMAREPHDRDPSGPARAALADAIRRSVEVLGNDVLWGWRLRHDDLDGVDGRALACDCRRFAYQMVLCAILDAQVRAGGEYDRDRGMRLTGSCAVDLLRRAAADPRWEADPGLEFRLHGQLAARWLLMPGFEGFTLLTPRPDSLTGSVGLRNTAILESARLLGLLDDPDAPRFPYQRLGTDALGFTAEQLLGCVGTVAARDMYAVKKSGEKRTRDNAAFFVEEEALGRYHGDEIVREADGNPCVFRSGTFMFRPGGSERTALGAFYTPDSLRRVLAGMALAESLPGRSADDVARLTVCEPALGGGAVLMETVNQISHAYLDKRQEETGRRIPHDEYAHELAVAKRHITRNNAYGADLDPFAVEIAGASLWLNTLQELPV